MATAPTALTDLDARPRVLVVDDDAGLARSLGRALDYSGLQTAIAQDGHSALTQLETGRFDVLVLDLRMPGLDGLDLLRTAARTPDFPATILHSAYLDVPTTVEAMRAGASQVLQKPTAVGQLVELIHQLTDQRNASQEAQPTPVCANPPREDHGWLLGDSPVMDELREAVQRVVRFRDIPVLIEGPTGTGKELVARSIHALTAPDEPLVSVNCAAIPADLFESELFGHEAGAFTSARGARPGLMEEAGKGVLFLDEVGELPLPMQAKLLRVLETREFRRVGSNRTRKFQARLVSATNRNLAASSVDRFRSDLYFRIAGHTIRAPALRDRVEDIPFLADYFRRAFCDLHRIAPVDFSPDALGVLKLHRWPGNVRHLRMVVENAVVHATGPLITAKQIERMLQGEQHPRGTAPPAPVASLRTAETLPDLERTLIRRAYQESGKNLSRAARTLGIPRTTLRDRLRRYGER